MNMKLKLLLIIFGSSAVISSSVSASPFYNNSWTGNGYRSSPMIPKTMFDFSGTGNGYRNKQEYQQRQEMIYQLEENNRLLNEMNNRDQNYFNRSWF